MFKKKVLGTNQQNITKNNAFKLEKFWIRREIGNNCLSNRVVNEWRNPVIILVVLRQW